MFLFPKVLPDDFNESRRGSSRATTRVDARRGALDVTDAVRDDAFVATAR